MPEGVFPKSDGQYGFASEFNRFAGAGEFIAMGSTSLGGTEVGSIIGSYVIAAGSLSNPAEIHIKLQGHSQQNSGLAVWLSGESINRRLSIGFAQSTSTTGEAFFVVGSPGSGFGYSRNHDSTGTGKVTMDNFDTNATAVVLFDSNHEDGGSIFRYSIQSFRGIL